MCLLMLALPGQTPPRADLETACKNNPDGFGFAFHTGQSIHTGRGMNAPAVIDRFYRERKKYPEATCLFHARFSTHGSNTVENSHPFRVGGDRRVILAHNGVMPLHLADNDDRSDTRLFAEDILPAMGLTILDDRGATGYLEDWLGGDKLVILSTHPDLHFSWYILNEDYGTWDSVADDDGKMMHAIWWSNTSHQTRNYWQSSTRFSWEESEDWEPMNGLGTYGGAWIKGTDGVYRREGEHIALGTGEIVIAKCPTCASALIDAELHTRICSTCQYCLDCRGHWQDCVCHAVSDAVLDNEEMDYLNEDEVREMISQCVGRKDDESREIIHQIVEAKMGREGTRTYSDDDAMERF